MKKVISIGLCIIFIFSFSVVANASESSKLSPDLIEALNNCEPEDAVGIDIGFNGKNYSVEDMPSWPDLTASRKELRDFYDAKNAEYCSILFENIEYKTIVVNTFVFIVEVKAEDVAKIAEYDIVRDISLYESMVFVPWEDETDKEHLFEHLLPKTNEPYYYDEVYYHHVDEDDLQSEIDWAIVYVSFEPVPSGGTTIVLDRVISTNNVDAYYPVHWAVYDAQLNEIISIDKIDITKYNGLEKGLEEAKVGNPLGDADLDGKLTVFDATYIQRVLAELDDFKEGDDIMYGFWGIKYDGVLDNISDINRDGERDIFDATAIQRKLAELDVPVILL